MWLRKHYVNNLTQSSSDQLLVLQYNCTLQAYKQHLFMVYTLQLQCTSRILCCYTCINQGHIPQYFLLFCVFSFSFTLSSVTGRLLQLWTIIPKQKSWLISQIYMFIDVNFNLLQLHISIYTITHSSIIIIMIKEGSLHSLVSGFLFYPGIIYLNA